MANKDKVYVGAVGLDIICDAETSLTGASAVSIKYKKPSGTTGTWTGAIVSSQSGPTYGVGYTTSIGDLDEAGVWKLTPYIEGLSGFTGHGKVEELVVDELYS